MENCVGFGSSSQERVPPPPAPCVREVSWGSQSVSVLLMGGGFGTGSGSAATATSSELHIFMDSTDRDRDLWRPSHTSYSGRFTTNKLVRILRERAHPTSGGSENRRAPPDMECPPPPLSLTSSISIEILHTGRSSRSIVSDLLWEDSFNSTAKDDPLACDTHGYFTQLSTVEASDSAEPSLVTTKPIVSSPGLIFSTCTCSESSSVVDNNADNRTTSGQPIEGSTVRPKNHDVAPRMPSRRRRPSEDGS
jgi:hypothetical protein